MGVAKPRNLIQKPLGTEIAIFIKRGIKEMTCFKMGGQIQGSGPVTLWTERGQEKTLRKLYFKERSQIQESDHEAPWTGNCYFHLDKY